MTMLLFRFRRNVEIVSRSNRLEMKLGESESVQLEIDEHQIGSIRN